MRNKILTLLCLAAAAFRADAQQTGKPAAAAWADSVFRTLTPEERIAQLMVVRLSSINTATREVTFYERQVEEAVRRYNIGGICLFQGPPVRQASLVNQYQSIAKTPILITIDGENGVGMRLDSVAGLPRQMMLGAMRDISVMRDYGRWVAYQCRRMGIQVNYAPVVDVNNNPDNPVINDRSFGEDRQRVADLGVLYMKGMLEAGIMGSAKHFPGHGDVAVDSHHDLPVINKSRSALDSIELYPFRALIREGIGSVMVGHLSIPVIEKDTNRATSISYSNVTALLRQELGFQGLTFTDALEMKGVTKHFPDGEASVEALIAGHDMLCLPGDIPTVVAKVVEAIKKRRLTWETIDARVRRVLQAKYELGLSNPAPVALAGLTEDLNRESAGLRRRVAEQAVTLARHADPSAFPLSADDRGRLALVSLGTSGDNAFSRRMRADYNADVYHFDYRQAADAVATVISRLKGRYAKVVISVHALNRFPARRFGMSEAALQLLTEAASLLPSSVVLFGNPYAARHFPDVRNLLVGYEDEAVVHDVSADILGGGLPALGRLPVSVTPALPAGTGIQSTASARLRKPATAALPPFASTVDSLARDAIRQQAAPGCVLLVVRDGRIVYQKAYGYQTYDSTAPMSAETLFDMASVTKICATNISVMKLYDEGRLDIDGRLGDYLPWVRGTDKERLSIRDILLHQAGLKAFIPFYRETMDTLTGIPFDGYYTSERKPGYEVPVASAMYLRNDFRDTMYRRILQSRLERSGAYIYSDNDFIFLGKVVEAISGLSLDAYVQREFYGPMGLVTSGFSPSTRFPLARIAPTEDERIFRRRRVHGFVHDPGAALFGGVAGHAGLFSNAHDIAAIMQMLLDKGVFNGRRYLSEATVDRFTAYGSTVSRRGLGFDKPEKDNDARKDPYPTRSASPRTFGHTGFTGTCAWADPDRNLVYVFLSNRVHPDGSNKLLRMNVRSNIHEALYRNGE